MTADREALLRAVCARPDDDTPRLVLADWLDERGGRTDVLQADFIRAQCELAREEEQSPRWRKLFHRQSRLRGGWPYHPELWPRHLEGRAISHDYGRGFVASLVVYAKRFLDEAERFYADDPIQSVRFVRLAARHGSVPPATLFAHPALARLRSLDLSGSDLTNEDVVHVANSPHLAGLRRLSLARNQLRGTGCAYAVVGAPGLPALDDLDLSANRELTDDAVAAVVAYPAFARLRGLDLSDTGVGPPGLRALAQSPRASGLERLRLARPAHEHRGPAAAEVIAGSPHLANLRELDLSGWGIGVEGLRALGHSPHLRSLRRLRLSDAFPDEAVDTAAAAPNFRGLYQLHLGLSRTIQERAVLNKLRLAKLKAAMPDAAIRFD